MKCFKITKCFQGGQTTYYAELSINKRVKKGYWEAQLNQWGDITPGGHNYGYRIYAKQCNRPKHIKKGIRLHFSEHDIEKIK